MFTEYARNRLLAYLEGYIASLKARGKFARSWKVRSTYTYILHCSDSDMMEFYLAYLQYHIQHAACNYHQPAIASQPVQLALC